MDETKFLISFLMNLHRKCNLEKKNNPYRKRYGKYDRQGLIVNRVLIDKQPELLQFKIALIYYLRTLCTSSLKVRF